ncbi:hypothetical protein GNI_164840 [Gregarina niphandrodes]|uniref:Uncharacterized protein n=1 Tax=Gregarina niphandrodes TaxID=110365 RepID=A0A023AYS5_GRENI|nr:hypothetical protein GNI_164840 [Gregarina niphandrodes]EZG43608.1 hypothetical protein GNI_164840 [Gregarina niphandrodes]|eukprot:XP_011133162.1 hypothetical protein GNI_164840 [Gregarina niphandrodes]
MVSAPVTLVLSFGWRGLVAVGRLLQDVADQVEMPSETLILFEARSGNRDALILDTTASSLYTTNLEVNTRVPVPCPAPHSYRLCELPRAQIRLWDRLGHERARAAAEPKAAALMPDETVIDFDHVQRAPPPAATETKAAKQKTEKAVDTEAVDTEAVDTKAVDTKAVDTEAVDPKAVDTKAVDTEAVDTKAVDTEAVDTKAVDTKAVGSKAVGSKAVDTKATRKLAATETTTMMAPEPSAVMDATETSTTLATEAVTGPVVLRPAERIASIPKVKWYMVSEESLTAGDAESSLESAGSLNLAAAWANFSWLSFWDGAYVMHPQRMQSLAAYIEKFSEYDAWYHPHKNLTLADDDAYERLVAWRRFRYDRNGTQPMRTWKTLLSGSPVIPDGHCPGIQRTKGGPDVDPEGEFPQDERYTAHVDSYYLQDTATLSTNLVTIRKDFLKGNPIAHHTTYHFWHSQHQCFKAGFINEQLGMLDAGA